MRIGEPARKHGVPDGDIRHAARHAIAEVDKGEGFTLLIGAGRDGLLLEVGVLDLYGDDPVAIHAMNLQPKHERYLN